MSDQTVDLVEPAVGTERERLIYGQPRAVWAVLGAGIVAFMGIGLVDPILPIIATGIHASGSQVELLFTSYFLIIGVSNLLAGFVSTRKRRCRPNRSPDSSSSGPS